MALVMNLSSNLAAVLVTVFCTRWTVLKPIHVGNAARFDIETSGPVKRAVLAMATLMF